jgi:hypothetical protein
MDCRTCKHNTYIDTPTITDWVSCGHPVTLQKQPRPEPGDPAWVNAMTGDMRIDQMERNGLLDCSAWEAQ